MEISEIKEQALKEIAEEDFRKAVEQMKLKIRNKKSLWDRIFPYKVIFVKKGVK
jgi:hypothetical protein